MQRPLIVLTGPALALVLLAGGCASAPPRGDINPGTRPPASQVQFGDIPYASWSDYEPPYRFYPGDELDVSLPTAPELSKTVQVQPDGRIRLPLIGNLMVADRTADEVHDDLERAYSAQLLRPQVDITVKAAPLKIFVGGEVKSPGVLDLSLIHISEPTRPY